MSQREFNWPSLSVTATSGPLQFNKDAVATTVSQDTVTPSNSVALPVALFNTAGPLNLTTDGNGLKVSNANVDIFGAGVSVQQFNQVQVSFDTAPGATLITNTSTSTGSNSIANGHALYSTGTGVTSSAKAVSVQINYYKPLYQSYAAFSAAFTTPTSANSYQRLGLYDASNGFFVGFSGLNFGVTTRSSGSDTFVNRASFDGDLLTGAATSKFTRNGTPEAINLNYSNLFRIRFAWLGSAPILFEVYSPDGAWVVFHTIRMPNLQLNPSISNPDLPMTLDVAKASSDATNLIVYTACWAAGANSNLSQITSTITDTTLAPLNRSVITGVTTGGGGGYVNVKVSPSGALVANVSGTVAVTSAELTSIDTKTPALVSGAVPSLMKVVKKDGTVVTPYGTENNAVAVGNFIQKFRDSFITAQPNLTIWDEAWTNQGSGFVAAGGNSSGSSYMKVSMCSVAADSEYILTSKATFKFPVRFGFGVTLSQRIYGQEVEISLVGVDGSGNIENNTAVTDLAVSGTINIASNVATINFATPHGLVGGDRVTLFGNTDSRLNYGPTIVSSIPTATQITVPLPFPILSPVNYPAGGFVRFEDPLDYAKNSLGLTFELTNAVSGSLNSRRNGAKFRTTALSNLFTTAAVISNNNNYTDSFNPAAENEFIGTMEEMFFSGRAIDAVSNTSPSSLRYTNGIPDEEKEYKIRVRAKSLVNMTVPIAKVVTISKPGTTLATVTTDVNHNLTTSDWIQVTGVRDQGNFLNHGFQTQVQGIISPTQFTVVMGSAATVSSNGGSVYRVQGSILVPGFFSNALNSISRTGNVLTAIMAVSIAGVVVGETYQFHGCDATSMGLYDGPYKLLRASGSTALFESVGADFASINCGGSFIKRTDARLHFIRMADYTRNAVEIATARGIVDASRSLPVIVANTVPVSGAVNIASSLNMAIPTLVQDATTTTPVTASITSNTISPAYGMSYIITIPVTVVSGTSPTLDITVEESDDNAGLNWYKVYDFPRITATGVYRSPAIPLFGLRVRYVQTVTGTTPSFTRSINRSQSNYPAILQRQFIDRTIVLTTLNSVTPTYFCDGCTIFNVNVTATTVTTPPVLALEGSEDGVKFYVITTDIQTVANVATTMSVSGFSPRFVRVRVVTAGVSATLDNIVIKAVTNSTPKSSLSGRNKVAQLFNDYTVTSVTTAGYVELIAATTAYVNKLEIFDSSGETLILAVGAAASEVDQFYILPGGNGSVDLFISAGSRISIKAKTATASSGLIAVNLYS